ELPGLRIRACPLDVIEEPADLSAREIGIEDEPGSFHEHRFQPVYAESVAEIGRPPVLPDDGVMDGPAALAIPDDCCLALVGDADRGDVAGREVCLCKRPAGRRDDAAPYLLRVMFDPAGGRKNLRKFLLRGGDGLVVFVKDDCPT